MGADGSLSLLTADGLAMVGGVLFLLGLGIGSFLNVVVLRYGRRGVVRGRSACPHCERNLAAWELIPVLSFILLRGRCRHCRAKISWQYPLVELASGLILVWTFYHQVQVYGITDWRELWQGDFLFLLVVLFLIWSILLIILVYDLYYKIIPDAWVFTFILLSVIWFVATLPPEPAWDLLFWLDIWAGPILFGLFFLPWYISGGRWLGLGDAKYVLGAGIFLGFISAVSAVILAFWIGAAIAIVLIALARLAPSLRLGFLRRYLSNISMKSEIPFGPFLIIGTWLSFFYDIDILSLSFWLS